MPRIKLPELRKPQHSLRQLYAKHVKVERTKSKTFARETNTLHISGVIDDWIGVSAAIVNEALQELDETQPLRVVINSVGGYVYEAIAIHNLLADWPAEVTTHVNSIAASAATIIALVGDKRTISDNAEFMVHQPWTYAMGNAIELRAAADHLDKTTAKILNLYERKSSLSRQEIEALLNGPEGEDGTYLTAQETLDAGWATEIISTSRQSDEDDDEDKDHEEEDPEEEKLFTRRTLAKIKLLT